MEDPNLELLKEDAVGYADDFFGIDLSKVDWVKVSKGSGYSFYAINLFICNIEDAEVIRDLSNGVTEIDFDQNIYNDGFSMAEVLKEEIKEDNGKVVLITNTPDESNIIEMTLEEAEKQYEAYEETEEDSVAIGKFNPTLPLNISFGLDIEISGEILKQKGGQ